jgi:DNA-binding NarL/FixJ family response regulator
MTQYRGREGLHQYSVLDRAFGMGPRAATGLQLGSSSADSRMAASPSGAQPKSAALHASSEELDSMFRQYPDLFRDASHVPTSWSDSWHEPAAGTIHTLLVREQGVALALREHLLSDRRVHLCAMAERLGDACRKIRQQSYQVIVLAMGEHIHDILPLLDLMNSFNPRAKAIAVLDRQASGRLQQMLHPKVMGYVAAEDASLHLADAVVEVAHGRFTASPSISDVVMRLTSSYLAARPPVISQSAALTTQASPLNSLGTAEMTPISAEASGFSHSSHLHSGSDASGFSEFSASNYALSTFNGSGFASLPPSPTSGAGRGLRNSRQLLSERESEILQLIAGGLSSADMALELGISVATVNTHIRNIFTKLGVRTRAQAIHTGVSQGLILVE